MCPGFSVDKTKWIWLRQGLHKRKISVLIFLNSCSVKNRACCSNFTRFFNRKFTMQNNNLWKKPNFENHNNLCKWVSFTCEKHDRIEYICKCILYQSHCMFWPLKRRFFYLCTPSCLCQRSWWEVNENDFKIGNSREHSLKRMFCVLIWWNVSFRKSSKTFWPRQLS